MTKDIKNLIVKPINRDSAKKIVILNHYMKTFPSGSYLHFGIFDKTNNKIAGIAVFGYSSSTDSKVKKLVNDLQKNEYIEMQRLWISDDFGHNAESYVLSLIIQTLKQKTKVKIIFTHAGGCKNDCGIVYQASSWLYFGKEICNDFYLTKTGEYKNIIAALRFGRISAKGRKPNEIGKELFGDGDIVKSFRYKYIYPIHKGIRRRLEKKSLPYPKDSAIFRKDQKWV
jgi:protein-arginine kinase activator protein McsA